MIVNLNNLAILVLNIEVIVILLNVLKVFKMIWFLWIKKILLKIVLEIMKVNLLKVVLE